MDSSFPGVSADPSKGNKMSIEEKRELVYEISNWSEGASEILQSWSRQEILLILCTEMGKERKYTGLTKLKIIEHLLKIVSEKKLARSEDAIDVDAESSLGQRSVKKQRKTEQPSRVLTALSNNNINNASASATIDVTNSVYCKNSACKATLSREDMFCKRCSCCVCCKYDDNKDPSLWLICNSEAPFQGVSCGMSCHLECALKHEKSGIGIEGKLGVLDGCFQCLSCRKVNDLLGCWRKQLLIAKDTRRVDILCYRMSLSQKLLKGTVKYKMLCEIIDEAVTSLEAEVGPLTGLPVKMGRGIVNRLSSGPEVQKLCGSALDLLNLMFSETKSHSLEPVIPDKKPIVPRTITIKLEDIETKSAAVIFDPENNASSGGNIVYSLWLCKADNNTNYPKDPTYKQLAPNTRFVVRGLEPATEYRLKVVSFNGTNELGASEVQFSTRNEDELEVENRSVLERSQSPVTNCSSLSNPSSVEDETNNVTTDDPVPNDDRATGPAEALKLDTKLSSESQTIEDMCTDNGSNIPLAPFVAGLESDLPITPYKSEKLKDGPGRTPRSKSISKDLENAAGKDGSSSKKRSAESNCDFEYYVKIIRWLECEGHIEKNFRQKFLTWYSLKASPKEVRIVKVFIDAFIEDPASLAGQLVDTFSDCVSSKRSSVVPAGFCMKLWH